MNEPIFKLMQDASIRKDFGQRVKQLRKQKGWTQKELANLIEVSHAQLNKYEGGLNTPPLDKLLSLAAHLETSVDYLLSGTTHNDTLVHNTRLAQRLQAIAEFGAEERDVAIKVLDALIAKHNMERTVKSMEG